MPEDDRSVASRPIRAAAGSTAGPRPVSGINAGPNLLDAVAVGLAEMLPDGRFLRANSHLCAMLKYPADTLHTLALQAIVPREDPPLLMSDLEPPLEEGGRSAVLRRLKQSDGADIWVELSAARINYARSDSIYLVTFIDKTRSRGLEIRAAESELRVAELEFARHGDPLARELNHRLRNVFPIILLLVRMTAERHPAAAEYCQALVHRLRALAAAEDVMRQAEADAVTLEAMIRTELLPFEENARVTVEGPPVTLRGAAAQCFALLLHELTTNAVKYGSLGVRNGTLTVSWQLESRDGRLKFEWREQASPGEPPSHDSGFGTFLISHSGELLGGTSSTDYAPEGLTYRLECPVGPDDHFQIR